MIPVAVETAMTTPVRTMGPDATMVEAARELREAAVGALVVVEKSDIVGMVTESDIITVVTGGKGLETTTVEQFMMSPVRTVASDATVTEAGQRMREHSVRRMPVVDDGELVGIVTTTDLAYYLPRLRATIRRERQASLD